MSSILRRGASKLAELIERSADPGATASRIKLYSKDDAGTTQLFAQDSAGTVHQLTPPSSTARDFMLAVLSADYTIVVNTTVPFNTAIESSGITINGSNQFTLTASKTYFCFAGMQLQTTVSSNTFCVFRFRTGAAVLFGVEGVATTSTSAYASNAGYIAAGIVTGETLIELRVTALAGAGTEVFEADFCWVSIYELAA